MSLASVLVGLVLAAPAAPPSQASAASPIRIANASLGVEAALPAGWSHQTSGLRDGQAFLAWKGDAAYAQLRAEREGVAGAAGDELITPLETHANGQMSQELRVHRGLKVLSVKTGRWRDAETVERVATWEGAPGARLRGRRVWFAIDGRIWCFVFHAQETAFTSGAADAQRILDSIVLAPIRPSAR